MTQQQNSLVDLIRSEITRLESDAAYRESQKTTFTPKSLSVLRKLFTRAISTGKEGDLSSFYKFLADGTASGSNLVELVQKYAKLGNRK